jgi:REP element-mobilizing transposase RayT
MNSDILKFKTKYRAESARRKGWDYSQAGCYFITICTRNKEMFFGEVVGDEDEAEVELSEIGKIADKFWLEIPKYFPFIKLYEHIIMPNHVHGIIEIDYEENDKIVASQKVETQSIASLQGAYKNKFGPQSNNLSSIIRGFKAGVKKYATINNIDFAWQPRFYDRIIRSEDELGKIREYIINNPLKWELDKNNPENLFM